MNPVIDDFGRIAALPESPWDHNIHYHRWLLRQLAASRRGFVRALEIGCGQGRFCVELARRFDSVTGIDVTPAMVQAARRRCAGNPRIAIEAADFVTWRHPGASFDAIASLATLHHLDLAPSLEKIKRLLAPGGRLVVLDLCRRRGAERLLSLIAFPLNLALQLLKAGRLGPSAAARAAWREHGRSDRYWTLEELREVAARVLPGSRVRLRLFWRCSLVWEKPRG